MSPGADFIGSPARLTVPEPDEAERRARERRARRSDPPTCGFCHGRPVFNAGRLVGESSRMFATCPRCGQEPDPILEDS